MHIFRPKGMRRAGTLSCSQTKSSWRFWSPQTVGPCRGNWSVTRKQEWNGPREEFQEYLQSLALRLVDQ